jgi:peptidoglycan/xylan/chitin deacetylase (PgdA/CDA1 family)
VTRGYRPLVLCYHAVSATWEHGLSVSAETLEAQIRSLLRRRYVPAPAAAVPSGRGRLLHVTFDDAFKNVFQALAPLERLGVPATVFACSSYAEDGRPFDGGKLAGEASAYPDELATMDWDDLRELVERGVEVGSHTVTHPHLPQLEDAELDRQLVESKSRLEDELRRPCPFLAYPFGEEDQRVRAAARRAGYTAAYALKSGRRPADPFAIPRVGVWRKDTLSRLALKTSLLGRYAVSARQRSRG